MTTHEGGVVDVIETLPAAEAPLADVPAPPTRKPLTGNDRCDRCGAQARVAIQAKESAEDVPHPGEVLLCGHHAREHEDKIREFIVLDERQKLLTPLLSSY